MYNILFKTDGSPSIGMGHIMRCLSLAREFRKFGCNVNFASRYAEGINEIKASDFIVHQLDNRPDSDKELKGFPYGDPSILEYEAEQINNIVENDDIKLLIIDSYNVTYDYFIKIKKRNIKVAYIDDINCFAYPVDILINGNISAPYLNYIRHAGNELMLLGTDYNLIREEFRGLELRKINQQIDNVLITTGGADPHNISTKLLRILLNDPYTKNFNYHVIIGSGFRNKDELRQISESNNHIKLYENVRKISRIMLDCDMAISSGGSTLYELCACGTPALGFIMAENQSKIVSIMSEQGYVDALGWFNELNENKLVESVKSMAENYKYRLEISGRMKKLVDGYGTIRIVESILKHLSL